MSWAVLMRHALATSLPVVMGPVFLPPSPVMGKTTAWTAQMRPTACVSRPNRPVPRNSTCVIQASVLMPVRCAMGRRTARTTVMKKAAVRYDIK